MLKVTQLSCELRRNLEPCHFQSLGHSSQTQKRLSQVGRAMCSPTSQAVIEEPVSLNREGSSKELVPVMITLDVILGMTDTDIRGYPCPGVTSYACVSIGKLDNFCCYYPMKLSGFICFEPYNRLCWLTETDEMLVVCVCDHEHMLLNLAFSLAFVFGLFFMSRCAWDIMAFEFSFPLPELTLFYPNFPPCPALYLSILYTL